MKNYRVYVVKTTIVEMCLDAKDKYDAKERWKDGVELMETDIACEAISAEIREEVINEMVKFMSDDDVYKYTNKMPPTRILDKWAVRKGISGIRNNKGQFVSRKSLIFVIARNIKLFGIKPSNFFTDAFNTAYKTLPRQFMQAYAKDAAKFLKFVSKEL